MKAPHETSRAISVPIKTNLDFLALIASVTDLN